MIFLLLNIEQEMSNDEVWKRSLLIKKVPSFDIRYFLFDILLFAVPEKPARPVLLDFQSAMLNPPVSNRWLFSYYWQVVRFKGLTTCRNDGDPNLARISEFFPFPPGYLNPSSLVSI